MSSSQIPGALRSAMAPFSSARVRPPAAKKLSERDAWSIALAWRDTLQGCVRLETDACDSATSSSLVPVFAWVSFVFNGSLTDGLREIKDTKDTAACARAAALAWFALSCCAGFGARENPHFWRRVFSELHAVGVPQSTKTGNAPKKPVPYRPQRPISDAVRFFDDGHDKDCVFPRVRMVAKYPQDGASVRAFVVASESVDRKLLKSLKRLAPFIRASTWKHRVVPVAIEGLDIEELVKVVRNLPIGFPSSALPIPSLPSPIFELHTVLLRRQDTRSTLAIRDLQTLSPKTQIVAEECEFAHLFHTQRGAVESLLRSSDKGHESLFSIQTLSLARSIGSRTKMAVACSSLPWMSSLQAVELTSTRFEVKAEGVDEWAWLGYAVFHPCARTKTSSAFTSLDLRLPYVRDVAQHVEAFKRMALGNNLLSALGQEEGITAASSFVYYQARLRARSTIRLDATDGDSVEMETSESDSWCTLCVDSISKLDEWTRAVVPGHGLAWVRSTDIVETMATPPGRSCVRHLRLQLPHIVNANNELVSWVTTPMLSLLSVLGPELKSLDMSDSLSMNKSTVRAILKRCPFLQILRVSHDGSFWQDEITSSSLSPRLRELELYVDASKGTTMGLQPLRCLSLQELRTLRVTTLQHESFAQTHGNFMVALATYPGILHGHWQYAGVAQFATYEKRRLHSLSLQRQMDCGQSDVSQVPMRLDGKLAFLSVVRDASSLEASVLGDFGPDVLRNVFSFSTSPVPRTVYIGRD